MTISKLYSSTVTRFLPKLAIGVCLAGLAAEHAQAEVWQLLASDATAQQYVDKQSVTSAVKAVEYWDKLVFAKPQAIGDGHLIKEIRSLSIANCAARTIAGEYYAIYDSNERLVDVQQANRYFRSVGQGSKGAVLLHYVCGVKPNPALLAKRKGGKAALLAELDAPPALPIPARPHIFSRQTQLARLITEEANEQHVDPALVKAVIAAESGYNPYALSPKGAIGLMQLLPATGRRFGVSQLFDPKQNIRAGVKYLSYLLKLFNQNVQLAVAAYNAGEQAIIKYGYKIPPYRETRQYVPRVISFYESYMNRKAGPAPK